MNTLLKKIETSGEIMISLPILAAKAVYLCLVGFLVFVKDLLPLSKQS